MYNKYSLEVRRYRVLPKNLSLLCFLEHQGILKGKEGIMIKRCNVDLYR